MQQIFFNIITIWNLYKIAIINPLYIKCSLTERVDDEEGVAEDDVVDSIWWPVAYAATAAATADGIAWYFK